MKKCLCCLFVLAGVLCACKEIDIPYYEVEDSAVYFTASSQSFSIKGISGDVIDVEIPLILIGPICDYERKVDVQVVDSESNTAVLGTDFTIKEAIVNAGAEEGHLILSVSRLPENIDSRGIMLKIEPNEFFSHIVHDHNTSEIVWTADYSRPANESVWKSWYYFFSPTYSKALHRLLVDYFGTDIEKSSYESKAIRDPDLIYRTQSWWYSSSREFYQMVKEHDTAHPDSPYMHSADVMTYSQWTISVNNGRKPEEIPTILSTLLVN